MSEILIIAEHANGRLNQSTAKCVSCALGIGAEAIDILVLAASAAAVAAEAAAIQGVRRVRTLERPENAEPLAAVFAPQVAAVAKGYTHLLGPSTTFGKDLVPRVAAMLGVGQISDVMAVESANRFVRPVYAGNALATVEAPAGQIVVLTVRAASFQPAANGGQPPGHIPNSRHRPPRRALENDGSRRPRSRAGRTRHPIQARRGASDWHAGHRHDS